MGSYMNFKNFEVTPQAQAPGSKLAATLPLTRQSSVYSLTFDEFQNTLGGSGKDFGSMNMDELLKNIWSAEETQAMATSSTIIGQGTSNNNDNNNIPTGNLNRQGSLTLPRTISQKTVDEVWKELYNPTLGPNLQQHPTLKEITLEEFLFRAGVVREDAPQSAMPNNNGLYSGVTSQPTNSNISLTMGFQLPAQTNIVPNQPSTLAMNMSNQLSSLPMNNNNNNNNGLSIGFQQPAQNNIAMNSRILDSNNIVPHQPSSLPMNMSGTRKPQQLAQPLFPKQANVAFASSMPIAKNTQLASPSLNNGHFQGGQLGMGGLVSGANMGVSNQLSPDGDTSSVSPSPYVFNNGARGRKSGTLEKAMERRHRRMIKNRESAARSRSRKQAYTLELEAEVEKLKEMNNELRKKQDELMELQKNKVLETEKTSWGSKRRCLRRTLTGPW